MSWLGWLSAFATLMVIVFLPRRYRDELGLDDATIGWIKGLAIGATGVGGLLFGLLGDRIGRKPALVLAVAIAVIGAFSVRFGDSAAWMMGCSIVAGLGIGGQWASGQTLLGETVPPSFRSRFGTMAQSGAPLGLGLASILVFEVGAFVPWRTLLLFVGLQALLVPAALRFLPESDLWRLDRARPRRFLEALVDLAAPDVRRTFGIVFLLTLLCMGNYWFTVTWLPEFMQRTWSLDVQQSGRWTLVFITGSLLGYGLFALVAEWIRRRPAFTLFCGIMAAGTAMITVFQGAVRAYPALVLLFAFIAGVGTGIWSSFGPLYTEVFPTRVRTTAGGVCMNVSRSFSLAAGPLVAIAGPDLALGVALAAVFAVGAGLCIWLVPETTGRAIRPEAPLVA